MPTINDFAQMASGAYDATPSVSGWHAGPPVYDSNSGLRSVIYSNGDVVVVAFRGTDNASDLVEDAELTMGMNTAMYPIGEAVASGAGSSGPVYVTGHSLGGAVAQVVGKRMELPFVTFNAPGVALLASRNIGSAYPLATLARLQGAVNSALRRPGQAISDIRSTFNSVNGKNYRLSTDIVSATGVHYGDIVTLPAGTVNPATAHGIATMIGVLSGSATGAITFPR